MGRTARDNRDLPHPRPVEKIELAEGNTKRRLIAAVLFLLIGAAALAYALLRFVTPESGWQAIQAGTAQGPTCGGEFVFLYELGAGGASPTVERRGAAELYTRACRKAFQLFHTMEGFDGVVNLYQLNHRPNQVLEVDPALYNAFAAVQRAGDRTVYLGPVYARYGDLFLCQDDGQLVDFDPYLSEAVAEEYAAIAAYAMDPQSVGVELLGEGKLRLNVSEEYLKYAKQEGIDRFLDFGWMKNAFVIDYLAQTMAEGGYTNGCITSYDGFARCLDGRAGGYSLNLYDQAEGLPLLAGVMEYRGPMSLVSLRSFSAIQGEELRFYRLNSGETRTLYLDPADGKCRSAVDSLTCYAMEQGCAQLAMEIAPVFIADAFYEGRLAELAEEGVRAVWCRAGRLWTTDPATSISQLHQGYELTVSP